MLEPTKPQAAPSADAGSWSLFRDVPERAPLLGLGLVFAWVALAFRAGFAFSAGGAHGGACLIAASAALAAVSFACWGLLGRAEKVFANIRVLVGVCVVAAVAQGLAFASASGPMGFALSIAGSALGGAALAMLVVAYGAAYARLETPDAVRFLLLSVFVAFFAFFSVVALPAAVGDALTCALPIAGAMVFGAAPELPVALAESLEGAGRALRPAARGKRGGVGTASVGGGVAGASGAFEEDAQPGPVPVVSYPRGFMNLIAAVAVFCMAVAFSYTSVGLVSWGYSANLSMVALAATVSAGLFVASREDKPLRTMRVLYNVVVPALVLIVTTLPLLEDFTRVIAAALLLVFWLIGILYWNLVSFIANNTRFAAVELFALAFAVAALGVLAGAGLAEFVAGASKLSSAVPVWAVGMGFLVLAFFTLGFSEDSFLHLAVAGRGAFARVGIEPQADAVGGLAAADLGTRAGGAASGASGREAADDGAVAEPANPAADGTEGASPAARFADGALAEQTAAFDAKLAAIGREHGFTRREQEVFDLLARGFGGSAIAEKLTISYHTSRAHTRNIYDKLQVHSRQELLDLVATYTPDER